MRLVTATARPARLAAALLAGLIGMSVTAVVSAAPVAARAEAASLQAASVKVWRGDCGRTTYELTVDKEWADWEARVRVYDPRGRVEETKTVRDGDPTTRKLLLCTGNDRLGRYKVTAEVTRFDEDLEEIETASARTFFKFGIRPKDRTTLSVRTTHVRHGFWKFSGVLKRKGEAYSDQRVSAQARISGVWYRMKTKTTNESGIVRFTARPKAGAGKYALRLHFAGSKETERASSKHFRIYP